MERTRRETDVYDAIVIGARCAGSPTAKLLARKGYRHLVAGMARDQQLILVGWVEALEGAEAVRSESIGLGKVSISCSWPVVKSNSMMRLPLWA